MTAGRFSRMLDWKMSLEQDMMTSESFRAGFDGMSRNWVCESREFLSTTSESPLMTAVCESWSPGLTLSDDRMRGQVVCLLFPPETPLVKKKLSMSIIPGAREASFTGSN